MTEAAGCSVCGAPLGPSGRCSSCGAIHTPHAACPHCGARAVAVAHSELRYACNACGAARIPAAEANELSGHQRALLARASAARTRRMFYWVGAAATATMLPFVALTALALAGLANAALAGMLIGGFVGLPLLAALVVCVRGVRNTRRIVAHALSEAWVSVAADRTRAAGRTLKASELGEELGVSEASAEELLALQSVDELLGHGATESAAPRLRIESVDAPPDIPRVDVTAVTVAQADAEAEQDALDEGATRRVGS